VDFDRASAEVAREIFRDLASKGQRLPTKDLIITTMAIAHNSLIFTCDKGFERFKEYGLKVKILEK
jgi:tRNA(fMet)-specific endonuclease VapC